MSDSGHKPWDRQPGESAKAYKAFVTYLELGEKRSILKAAGGSSGRARWFEKWSSKFSWVERVASWETAELAANIRDREKAREKARQVFVDAFPELAQTLVEIASMGGAQMPQVNALRHALALGGLVEPKTLEVSGGASALRIELVDEAMEAMSDDELDGFLEEDEEE